MADIMDGLNKAKDVLQDLGEKAVDGAKDLLDKVKPAMAEALDKVGDSAKNLAEKTKATIDHEKDLKAQISDEVKAQVNEIRQSAATGTDPIHDYIQSKFAKTEEKVEEKAEEVKEEVGDVLEKAAADAKMAADKVEGAAQDALKAVGATFSSLAERVQGIFEHASEGAAESAEAIKAEVAQEAEEIVKQAEEAVDQVEDAAEQAETAEEKAQEIFEGPTPDVLSEVFENYEPEEPSQEEDGED